MTSGETLDSKALHSSSPARVLRHPNFRWLWVGGAASASGVATANVVILWMLYASTHSAFVVTLMGILEFVPTITIGLLAGALADRYDRRRLMVLSDLLRALLMGGLAAFVFVFGFNPVVVLLNVFFIAAFGSLFTPASHAILPTLLEKAEINDGNGVLEVGWTAAAFVGSPLGGLLLVTLGVVSGLIYNSLTFAFSALMISLISVTVSAAVGPTKKDESAPSLLSEVKSGLHFLRSQSALLIITIGGTVGNFFSGMALTYVVVYASVFLHTSALFFGIIGGTSALSWGIGSLLAGRLKTHRRPGSWSAVCWGFAGVPFAIMVLAPSIPLAVACLGIESALAALGNNIWRSTVQRTVANEFLGRYFATDEAGSYAMIPAGMVAGGLVLVTLGVVPLYLIAGIGATFSGLGLLISRDVRSWGRTAPVGVPSS